MLTLLRNAELYAPEARGRRDLLIGGERVLAVGEALPATPLADEVDLAGARVIPGLIDGHVHLGGGGGESGFASRVPPVTLGTLVRAGVTSVVSALLVVLKEANEHTVLAWMKAATGHHWVTHGIIDLILFVLIGFLAGLLIYIIKDGPALGAHYNGIIGVKFVFLLGVGALNSISRKKVRGDALRWGAILLLAIAAFFGLSLT